MWLIVMRTVIIISHIDHLNKGILRNAPVSKSINSYLAKIQSIIYGPSKLVIRVGDTKKKSKYFSLI